MANYSRYDDTILIYDEGRLRNGLRKLLDTTAREDDIFHVVKRGQRADTLAHRYYDDSTLWWVIADYNDLRFPLLLEEGILLRLPSYSHLFNNLLEG